MSITLCYAAAGAGKTHALVYNYLLHALKKPTAFKHILAITFTNKAAQEMKKRIIAYLHLLTQKNTTHLHTALIDDLSYNPSTLQKQAQQVLNNILYNYDALSISTIDSLWQQIVTTFPNEIQLPPNYEIVLNQASILDQAMHVFWHTLSQYPCLQKALHHLSLQKIKQGNSWDCHHNIRALTKATIGTQHIVTNTSNHQAILHQLKQEATTFEKKLIHIAHQLWHPIQKAHLTQQDFLWSNSGIWNFLAKATHHIVEPKKRIRNAVTDIKYWLKQGHATHFIPTIQKELQTYLKKYINHYDNHHQRHATTHALHTLHYLSDTTNHIYSILQQQYHQKAKIPIHQLPNMVQKLITQLPIRTIYKKMQVDYHTIMVDEFQDVSNLQWQLIKPLLKHCLENQGSSFLVGDSKQAIYGWRGSNPDLLVSQVAIDIHPCKVKHQVLDHNYRSAANIINFNNVIFSTAPQLVTNTLHQQMTTASADKQTLAQLTQITQTYAHVQQKIPSSNNILGHVEVTFLPHATNQPKKTWQKTATQQTIHTIQQLLQQGHHPSEIALLVRDNREAQHLSDAFFSYKKQHPNFPINITNHQHISHNPYVQIIILALRYIQNDQTPLVLNTLIHYYQTYIVQQTTQAHWSVKNPKEANTYLPKDFLNELTNIADMPLYMLVSHLITHFGLNNKSPNIMHAFLDIVANMSKQGHIHQFLHWWDQEGHQTPIPATNNINQIAIMTIHQAKGLAFDIVLIPFCTWTLDHPSHTPPLLWVNTHIAPFNQLGNIPVYYSKQLTKTYFASSYFQEKRKAHIESLNLLYVAFTRAKKQLHIWAIQNHTINNVGSLLHHTLKATIDSLPWQRTTQNNITKWQLGKPTHQNFKSQSATHTLLQTIHNTTNTHQKWLAALQQDHTQQGKQWHAILAKINTKHDIIPTLDRHLQAGHITSKQRNDMLNNIASWWQHNLMKDWFSGRWHVAQEPSILLPSGDSLRPDRIMTQKNQLVVLDFKTGKPRSEHHLQMHQYTQALQKISNQDIKAYLFYTQQNKLVAA